MNEFFFENAGKVIDCRLHGKLIASDSEEADDFIKNVCFNCFYLVNEGRDKKQTLQVRCTYQGVW